MQTRILLAEDKDVSNYAQNRFEEKGIKFVLGTSFEVASLDQSSVTLRLNGEVNQKEISAPKILVAAGVVGNLEGLGLEKIGVETINAGAPSNQPKASSLPLFNRVSDLVSFQVFHNE